MAKAKPRPADQPDPALAQFTTVQLWELSYAIIWGPFAQLSREIDRRERAGE